MNTKTVTYEVKTNNENLNKVAEILLDHDFDWREDELFGGQWNVMIVVKGAEDAENLQEALCEIVEHELAITINVKCS